MNYKIENSMVISEFIMILLITFSLYFIISQGFQQVYAFQSSNIRDTSIQVNIWHIYKNQSQGLSIQYPSDWTKAITKNSIRFSPTSNNNSGLIPVSFIIHISPSQNLALEDTVSLELTKDRQNLTGFKLVESVASKLADNTAYKVLYQYKDGVHLFNVMEFW